MHQEVESEEHKSSQVNTLPKAKSKTRSKQNKDMHKCSSVYSEQHSIVLTVLRTSGVAQRIYSGRGVPYK